MRFNEATDFVSQFDHAGQDPPPEDAARLT